MSSDDDLVILPSSGVVSPMVLQLDTIVPDEEKRQELMRMLRQIPAVVDVSKKLIEGKTYQAVFPLEALNRMKDGTARLDKKGNGLFGVLIRDVETGHITDHVSLKEIMPDVLSSLNQIAIQQSLADIVCRLEIIDEKITDILQGQFNDRLAEVESGIHLYEQAIVNTDPEKRSKQLDSAITQLISGRNKLLKSIDFSFMDKLPRNKMGMRFFTLKHGDIPNYIQSKAEPIWKAAHAIVIASRYLVLAYSAWNQPEPLRVSLDQVKGEVKVFQEKMGEIVNWLPPTSHWRESLITISKGVLPNVRDLDGITQKTILIEFKPKEIAPPKGVDYDTLQE